MKLDTTPPLVIIYVFLTAVHAIGEVALGLLWAFGGAFMVLPAIGMADDPSIGFDPQLVYGGLAVWHLLLGIGLLFTAALKGVACWRLVHGKGGLLIVLCMALTLLDALTCYGAVAVPMAWIAGVVVLTNSTVRDWRAEL